jgi:putative peptidoglycan lipid II flippase
VTPPVREEDQLGRRAAVMAAGTVLSRLTGFGRVVALAYVLGTTALADTYNLANVTPNIIYELVLGGILSATLVPVFVSTLGGRASEREGDDEAGWHEVSALVTVVAAALVAVTVALALAAPALIQLYTAGEGGAGVADQRAVAVSLLRLFAPQVALYGVISLSTALLQARRRFAAPMFAPVLNNLVVIGVILALPRHLTLGDARADGAVLVLLGLGTTAGVLVQAAAQWVALRRAGVRLRWVWDPGAESVRRVLRLSGWTLGFVATNQVALFVVLALARDEPGGVSAYQYAQVFFVLPHAIFTVSVISALLPELAAHWARRDVDRFRAALSLGLRSTAVVLVPAAAGYVVLARPVIDLILEHGATTASSAATIAHVLTWFAVGLPGFSAFLLLTRAYQAMEDTRSVFWLYVLENGLNIVLAVVLFPAMGIAGLAAAYAAAYTVAAMAAAWHLRRRTAGLDGDRLAATLGRVAIATAGCALAAAMVSMAVGGDEGPRLAARVGAAVIAGVSVYVVVARALRVAELMSLLQIRRRPT